MSWPPKRTAACQLQFQSICSPGQAGSLRRKHRSWTFCFSWKAHISHKSWLKHWKPMQLRFDSIEACISRPLLSWGHTTGSTSRWQRFCFCCLLVQRGVLNKTFSKTAWPLECGRKASRHSPRTLSGARIWTRVWSWRGAILTVFQFKQFLSPKLLGMTSSSGRKLLHHVGR